MMQELKYCLKLIRDDGMQTLPSFGPEVEYRDRDDNWLWTRSHAILVLSIPFFKGSHAAKRPSDFLPIVEFLHNLHKRGIAHGDIRCFNILFVDDQKGYLIDLDYAGRDGIDKYPMGYVSALADGVRMGDEHEVLETWHDWLALHFAMFVLHEFDTSDEQNKKVLACCSGMMKTLQGKLVSEIRNKLESDLIRKMEEITKDSVWTRELFPPFEDDFLLVEQGKDDATNGSLLTLGIGDVDVQDNEQGKLKAKVLSEV